MKTTRLLLALGVPVALVACRDSGSEGSATTQPAPTSAAPTSSPTTADTTAPVTTAPPTAPETTTPATTTPATTPATTTPADTTTPTSVVPGPTAGSPFDVVLLDEADQLNVRVAADPAADIVTRLDPTTAVTATGRAAEHDGSIWYEITAGGVTGWANTFYLAPQWSAADFRSDPQVLALVDQLLPIMRDRGDLRPVTGRRGLIVSHFDPPRRFKPAELAGLLTSSTEYGWGSSACSPEECGTDTFTEAFADPFVQAYDDPDRRVVFDEIIGGGNMMLQPIPAKFAGVHYVAIYDSGDNPEYSGLDWSTWYIYFVIEQNRPVIVGLSTDEWAP